MLNNEVKSEKKLNDPISKTGVCRDILFSYLSNNRLYVPTINVLSINIKHIPVIINFDRIKNAVYCTSGIFAIYVYSLKPHF